MATDANQVASKGVISDSPPEFHCKPMDDSSIEEAAFLVALGLVSNSRVEYVANAVRELTGFGFLYQPL